MGPDHKLIKEINLLSQPQPLELTVTRNLSSWFTDVPDLTVVGGLKSLQMQLSKYDYAIALAVLAENFAEGGPPPPKSPVMSPETPLLPELRQAEVPGSQIEPTSRLTKIKVEFSVENISAKLYLTELPDVKQTDEMNKMEPLCGMEIDELRADVEMFNDSSMLIQAQLRDIGLDDIVAGLETATGAKGRLNFIQKENFLFIDDTYNANPTSMRAAAQVLLQQQGLKVMVMGDIGELGESSWQEHHDLGRDLTQLSLDQLVVVGEFAAAAQQGSAHSEKLHVFATQAEALPFLVNLVQRHQPQSMSFLFKGSRYTHMESLMADLMEKI